MKVNYYRNLLNPRRLLSFASGIALACSLGSCHDDIEPVPENKPTEVLDKSRPITDYIGKVGFVFDSEMSPVSESSARVAYYLEDRDTRRGNAGSGEYKDELSPTMNVKIGDRVQGMLIFLREPRTASEDVLIIRKEVQLEVTYAPNSNTYNPNQTVRVKYLGDVDFPLEHNLAQEFVDEGGDATATVDRGFKMHEGQWYVMGILGYNSSNGWGYESSSSAQQGNKLSYNWISQEELDKLDPLAPDRTNGNYAIQQAFRGASAFINNPHVSQWKRLKIYHGEDSYGDLQFTGVAEQVVFRPQGTFITYDLGINENLLQDVRAVGVASNVVDFRGYYNTDLNSLYNQFKGRDKSTGIAPPEWVSVHQYSPLEFYDSDDATLHTGERIYPYDLVTTSYSSQPMWGGSASAKKTMEGNPSIWYVYYVPGKSSRVGGRDDISANAWVGNMLGSWVKTSGGGWQPYDTRRIVTVWGMPRKTKVAKPATVFFASVYPVMDDELYKNDMDPTERIYSKKDSTQSGRRQIRDYEVDLKDLPTRITESEAKEKSIKAEIDKLSTAPSGETENQRKKRTDQLEAQRLLLVATQAETQRLRRRQSDLPNSKQTLDKNFPQSLFDTFSADSTLFYDQYLPAYLASGGLRAQPWLTLHQSNAWFSSGMIYHARPTLTSDLIITEVFYENRMDGQNYSMVEVYNPMWLPADLTQYAIARLIPSSDGTHLAFRKYDGTTTENLSEAQLLPLSAVVPNQPANNTAYTLSKFTAPSNYDARALSEKGEQGYNNRLFQIEYSYHVSGRGKYSAPGWYTNYEANSTVSGAGARNPDIYKDDNVLSESLDHDIGSMRYYLLPRQTQIFGATGWVNTRLYYDADQFEPSTKWQWVEGKGWQSIPEASPLSYIGWEQNTWRLEGSDWFFDYWRNYTKSIAPAKAKKHLRAMMAYADGPMEKQPTDDKHRFYKEGTLDYHPGDAFVLVKKMADGGLQIIDATGPVGKSGSAFPGTYADFKQEFDRYKTGYTHFSVQKMQAVDYPFIPPFRTTRVPQSKRYSSWSDTWRVVTNYQDYTTGYYTDSKSLHTDFDLGPLTGLYGAPFPPYHRSVWKGYDWQKYKALRPQFN